MRVLHSVYPSPTSERAGRFQLLAAVDNAAVNLGVQPCLGGPALNAPGAVPRGELWVLWVFCLQFSGAVPHCLPQQAAPQQCTGAPISPHP